MKEHPNLKIIRYLLIIAAGISLGLTWKGDHMGLILFLVILLISQLRMFGDWSDTCWEGLLYLQVLLTLPMNYYLDGQVFALMGLLAVDLALVEDPVRSGLGFTVLTLSGLAVLFPDRLSQWSLNLLFSAPLYLVFRLLREELAKKEAAQSLYDELRISQGKLKEAYDELAVYAQSVEEMTTLRERNRISREIHDSVGHDLSTILIQLGALDKLSQGDARINPMIQNLHEFSKQSLEHARQAVKNLKPVAGTDALGLIQNLLHQYERMTDHEVIFSVSRKKWPLSDDQAAVLFRVIQEFLSNSSKHAQSKKINVTIIFDEESLTLTLKDDGRGVSRIEKGFGLKAMEERLTELGGDLDLSSQLGEGFQAIARLPKVERLKMGGSNE